MYQEKSGNPTHTAKGCACMYIGTYCKVRQYNFPKSEVRFSAPRLNVE
jgi:hypothetical protein